MASNPLRAWIEDFSARCMKAHPAYPTNRDIAIGHALRDAKRFADEWDRRLGEQWGVCAECNEPTSLGDLYMVTDEVWAKYGAGERVLHPACLQGRLRAAGRALTAADFTTANINNAVRLGLAAEGTDDD